MILFLIRHAQSNNNALYDRYGHDRDRSEDPELTPTGLKQAEVLAAFLKSRAGVPKLNGVRRDLNEFKISYLYSSLMVRAVSTGSLVARAFDIPLQGWSDLHENGGIYMAEPESGLRQGLPGKPLSYFKEQYPDFIAPEDLSEHGWWNRPIEEQDEWRRRAERVLADLNRKHGASNDQVGIITHGGFYNSLMRLILGISDERNLWFVLHNAAITRIDILEEGVDVVYSNRVDFMPPDLIT